MKPSPGCGRKWQIVRRRSGSPRIRGKVGRENSQTLGSAAADPRADAYYSYSVAQMYVQAGRFKDAVPFMKSAIKRDPNSAALWTQLAQLLTRADSTDEAVSAARKAVELAPDQVSTHMTLAELLRTQRKYAEAEAELERAIQLSPNDAEAYLTLARVHVEQKAYDKARAVLLRLVEQQPRLAQAQFLLGRLAIETENWDEAIARLTAAVEIDPDHDGAWSALGAVYGEALHKSDEAITVYRRAVRANPDNPAFADKLADLSAQVEIPLSDQMKGFAGMRWFEFDLTEGGGSQTLQEEIFIGLGYRF